MSILFKELLYFYIKKLMLLTNKKGQVQCINNEILEKLSLKTRNKFLNYNLKNFLRPKYFNFLKETQEFFEKFEKRNNITHNEDLYDWIPEIGRNGYITRMHKFENLGLNFEPFGMTTEFMRILAMDFFDPQLAMGLSF